jgi:hypothetical protein
MDENKFICEKYDNLVSAEKFYNDEYALLEKNDSKKDRIIQGDFNNSILKKIYLNTSKIHI